MNFGGNIIRDLKSFFCDPLVSMQECLLKNAKKNVFQINTFALILKN